MIKGNLVELVPASLDKRHDIYNWCFNADTSKYHAGEEFQSIEIPTFEEFCEDYEDYYFTGEKIDHGRGFIIVADGVEVGFTNYACLHLKPYMAELDIWLNSEKHLGKGYGVDAITALCDYLHSQLGVKELILRPSRKNEGAVKSYKRAGFEEADITPSYYLLDEFVDVYGSGDYGEEETVTMIKRF